MQSSSLQFMTNWLHKKLWAEVAASKMCTKTFTPTLINPRKCSSRKCLGWVPSWEIYVNSHVEIIKFRLFWKIFSRMERTHHLVAKEGVESCILKLFLLQLPKSSYCILYSYY